ncbi:hypothetical protein Tco_0494911 [Tanacetum coccineum]
MAIAKDEPSVGKADVISGQWVDITMNKADASTSEFAHIITSDFEDDSDIQEPLPLLPKLTRADPSSASKSLISLSNLTANMADLTLNIASKEMKKSSNKVSQTYVFKKNTKSQHPAVQNSCPDKIYLASTKKLLLTLMEEVKGIKNYILLHQLLRRVVQRPLSKSLYKTIRNTDYLKRSVWYLDSGCSRHMTGVKQYPHRYSKEPGPKVVFGDDPSGGTKGYGSVNCSGITFTRVAYVNGLKHNLISISQLCDANFKVLFTKTQGTIFNQKDEVVLIAPRRIDVYVIDMSSFNKDCNACFFAKASPSVNWLWAPLRNFDEQADDVFFLGYSPVAKAFRVFNIRRQEMEEIVHITFSEDDEAISQTSTEGDAINFNEIVVLPTLQNSITFEEPPEFMITDNLPDTHEQDHAEFADILESAEPQDNVLSESISDDQPTLIFSPLAEVIL